jgi:hypothetical protein
MQPDHINGTFEFLGGIAVWSNVHRIWKDRELKGINWIVTLFFLVWTLWNLYYYPALGQWWSFWGGLSIASGNLAWLLSLLYIMTRKKHG